LTKTQLAYLQLKNKLTKQDVSARALKLGASATLARNPTDLSLSRAHAKELLNRQHTMRKQQLRACLKSRSPGKKKTITP